MTIPSGPDVTLFAPTEDLTDTQPGLLSNPRRRTHTFEHPALDLYAGHADFLVKTALIRSDRWKGGAGPLVQNGEDAAALCAHLAHADQEHIIVLSINKQNRLMSIHETAIGGMSESSVELKQALKVPVLSGAAAVILVHNHPGGNPQPSRPDIEMTTRIGQAFDCLGITLLDHVIVALGGSFSFYEHGLMP